MSMLRLDDRLLGRFRVDAQVAEGGMGIVYRGFDLKIDRPIAIKVLRPDAIENAARFEREATILATLDHPGVVRYVAHGVAHEGSPFLVVEWIEGVTLAAHVQRIGLTPAESVAVVRRVAEALGAAHACGLVHRDIKPENILLAGGDLERTKVIDFGLVKRTSGDPRLTETGAVVGTPGYMAPEQARGDRELDARSDVFALGCVLYECLTGTPAFSGRNAAAVMARIVLCDPPVVSDLWPAAPAALERVVHRMLARRPDDRPADGGAVAAELTAVVVPDGPRRRRAAPEDVATAIVYPGRTATHVIFVQLGDAGALAEPVVARFGAHAHALGGGTMVVVLHAHAATVAAACALALRDALGEAPIVLVGPSDAGAAAAPLVALLETGAEALELADLRTIFGTAAPAPGAIRIDPTTAGRLAASFEVCQDATAHYLIGRRRP